MATTSMMLLACLGSAERNLISDVSEGITNIEWTVYGKIKSITKNGGKNISYTYDAAGNRISKEVNGKKTWYIRDASGNVMSIYSKGATENSGHLTQTEVHLYGSSRLGIFNVGKDMDAQSAEGNITTFTIGKKFFELTNHLGNVLATVSDKKTGVDTNGDGIIDYYTADIVSANDYYPFGMMMAGRKYINGNNSYRYGFNGQERSSELNNDSYTADFWQYDARLGRRWNRDPVFKEYESPYATFSNNPLLFNDPNGNDPEKPKTKGTVEGQQETTSETTYNRLHNIPKTKSTTWNWHAGGLGTGKQTKGSDGTYSEVLTEAGWYDSEGYLDVLASSSAAKQLARDAGYSSWVRPGAGSRESLDKFIGEGLNDNAANYLNSAAWKVGSHANFMASGYVKPSGFNVEDMLGVGLLMKAGIKAIGGYVIKNISARLSATAVMRNTVDDFVKLFKPVSEYDLTKTLYRGTTGSEGRGNLLFLTDDAAVAATYIKNGGQVMRYEVSQSSLFSLRQRGILTMKEDIHKIGAKEIRHSTYEFSGSNLRQALNQIATPNK